MSLTPNSGAFPPAPLSIAGLHWMVDFNAALAAGMALKIPLTAAQRSAGFDRIVVYGTRGTDATAPATFAALLNAHHYTDGVALVPQGSATNNTADAPSAYSRSDPDYATSFAVERQGPLTTNPACDGLAFATATGIPAGTFDHVGAADRTGTQASSDMLLALWPATLGYFLAQMMAAVFTPDQIESAREYVLNYVRPRGPIPPFRVGRTPYGVLPVTSLRSYQMSAETVGPVETGLVGFVRKLWPTWLASSAAAPHMQAGQDPDTDLMAVLGMDASSMTFQGRAVLGPAFLWNWLSFLGVPQSFQGQWWQNSPSPASRCSTITATRNGTRALYRSASTSIASRSRCHRPGRTSVGNQPGHRRRRSRRRAGKLHRLAPTAPIADIQAETYRAHAFVALVQDPAPVNAPRLLDLAAQEEVQAGALTLSQSSRRPRSSREPEPTAHARADPGAPTRTRR